MRRLGPRGQYALRSFAGYLAFAVIAFGGAILGARLLGTDGKGAYTAWTLGSWLMALLVAGPVPVGIGRAFLSGGATGVPGTVLRHAATGLLIGFLCVCIAAVAGYFSLALAVTFLVALPAGVIAQDLLVLMQAAKRPWGYQLIRIATPVVVLIGLAAIALSDVDNPTGLAITVFAVGTVLSAIVALWLAPSQNGSTLLSSLVRRGRGSTIANIADVLLLRVDQLFVLVFAGVGGLGVYSVAVNWSETSLYLGHAIGQSAFEGENTFSRNQVKAFLARSAYIVALGTIGVALAGWVLIPSLFGQSFSEARLIVVLMAPGIVFRTLGYTLSQALLARGRASEVSRMLVRVLVVAAFAWPAGILVSGIEGAAVMSSLVYGAQFLSMLAVMRKTAE